MLSTRLLLRFAPRAASSAVFRAASSAAPEPDWVRTSIHKLLEQAQKQRTPELKRSLQALQNQLQEAELCVQDCREDPENLKEEIQEAEKAVDQAVECLVEVLDGLREVGGEKVNTEDLVKRIKGMRADLGKLRQESSSSS